LPTGKSFKEINEGNTTTIPEQAFYMKGTIDEVLEAAEKLKQRKSSRGSLASDGTHHGGAEISEDFDQRQRPTTND